MAFIVKIILNLYIFKITNFIGLGLWFSLLEFFKKGISHGINFNKYEYLKKTGEDFENI